MQGRAREGLQAAFERAVSSVDSRMDEALSSLSCGLFRYRGPKIMGPMIHLAGVPRSCMRTGKGIEPPQSENAVRMAGEDQMKATTTLAYRYRQFELHWSP